MRSNYLKRVAQICGDDYATSLERSLMAHIVEAEKALADKAIAEQYLHEHMLATRDEDRSFKL